MSDTATSWIAPRWTAHYWGVVGNIRTRGEATINVLNPGAKDANVTLHFFDNQGKDVRIPRLIEQRIPANSVWRFKPELWGEDPKFNPDRWYDGWLAITSDNPVLPSGVTLEGIGIDSREEPALNTEYVWVPMTFYRAEAEFPPEPHRPDIPHPQTPPVG